MRKKLEKLGSNKRHRFSGVVDRFGTANEWKYSIQTVMLKDIKLIETGEVLTDHLWLKMRKQLSSLGLKVGDVVSFDARVAEYWKGYKGWNIEKQMDNPVRMDYTLQFPTNFGILNREVKIKKPKRRTKEQIQAEKEKQLKLEKENQEKIKDLIEKEKKRFSKSKIISCMKTKKRFHNFHSIPMIDEELTTSYECPRYSIVNLRNNRVEANANGYGFTSKQSAFKYLFYGNKDLQDKFSKICSKYNGNDLKIEQYTLKMLNNVFKPIKKEEKNVL